MPLLEEAEVSLAEDPAVEQDNRMVNMYECIYALINTDIGYVP